MAADTQVQPITIKPAQAGHARALVLPFVNTSFATGLKLYFIFWPLWWYIGIEQLLPIFFLGWATLRFMIQARGRVRLGDTVPIALLLAAWWLVPAPWVSQELFDVFVRTFLVALSQALMLFLFVNCIRTQSDWQSVVTGLDYLSAYIVMGTGLFLSGAMRGQIFSILGYILPQSVYGSSEFFASIAIRDFGLLNPGTHGALPFRISSFALEPADLGTISLLLIPFVVWRFSQSSGWMRYLRLGIIGGLFICFYYAEVRIAYIAFTMGLLLFLVWRIGFLQRQNRLALMAMVTLVLTFIVGVGFFAFQSTANAISDLFTTVRPGSIFVRLHIYRETFRLLPEHLIAGWGSSIRIEGFPNVYAAGTHSTYLGMLFQHGIVGLLLYLGLWATIWRKALYWFRSTSPIVSRTFWGLVVITMLMFNIRESTASWMWDQTVAMTLWAIWGLVISASQAHSQVHGQERSATGMGANL